MGGSPKLSKRVPFEVCGNLHLLTGDLELTNMQLKRNELLLLLPFDEEISFLGIKFFELNLNKGVVAEFAF